MIYLSDPDRNTDGWRLVALFIGDGSMSVPVMQRGDTTDTVVVPDGMTADDAWEQNGLRVPLIVALTDDQFVTDSQAIDRRLAAQLRGVHAWRRCHRICRNAGCGTIPGRAGS
jgi:sulfur carrier protein ThiS